MARGEEAYLLYDQLGHCKKKWYESLQLSVKANTLVKINASLGHL